MQQQKGEIPSSPINMKQVSYIKNERPKTQHAAPCIVKSCIEDPEGCHARIQKDLSDEREDLNTTKSRSLNGI